MVNLRLGNDNGPEIAKEIQQSERKVESLCLWVMKIFQQRQPLTEAIDQLAKPLEVEDVEAALLVDFGEKAFPSEDPMSVD